MIRILSRIVILIFPAIAFGNVVWPALYAETKVYSLPIIALSLLLEYLVIRKVIEMDTRDAALAALAANFVSGIVGLFLRPLAGLAWELSLGQLVIWIFDWGTFNPVAWFFVPIIGGALNAILELLTIRLLWKRRLSSRTYFCFWAVNWVTVGFATIWVIAFPPQL